MNCKSETNREFSRITTVTLVSGAFLLMAILLIGIKGQTVSARFEATPQQGMNPEQVAATVKANAQELKGFSHQQRMQLQLKGETKKVTLNLMTYDMYGTLQKTLLSEQPADAPPSGRRLKRRIVAKKKGEFHDMMEDIAALVKSYTAIPPDQLRAALKQGSFTQGQGDMRGALQVQMRNLNQQGDSITIWIDQTAMLFRRAVIETTYEGNPVTTTANYAMLPSGEVYMGQAILNYPKKQVVVQIDNSNYQRSR